MMLKESVVDIHKIYMFQYKFVCDKFCGFKKANWAKLSVFTDHLQYGYVDSKLQLILYVEKFKKYRKCIWIK